MQKGPERDYRCRARYCRCLSGRTISTQFYNATPPAPNSVRCRTYLEIYFPDAGEVVMTVTTRNGEVTVARLGADRRASDCARCGLNRAASVRGRIDNDDPVAPTAPIRSDARGARVPNALSPKRAGVCASANVPAPTRGRAAPPALLQSAGVAEPLAQRFSLRRLPATMPHQCPAPGTARRRGGLCSACSREATIVRLASASPLKLHSVQPSSVASGKSPGD